MTFDVTANGFVSFTIRYWFAIVATPTLFSIMIGGFHLISINSLGDFNELHIYHNHRHLLGLLTNYYSPNYLLNIINVTYAG